MELFKETEKLITYRTNIEGKYYDVDYNKDNKTIIIKINSEILSDNGYKKIIGELYKESIKDIKDYKDYKFEFSPSNGLEKERSKKAIKTYDIKDKAFIKELNNNNNNGDINNKDGEKIGNLSEGYRVNSEDNSLSKDGIKLGKLDDINSMGKSNNMNKPKVSTLEKPSENAGIIDIRIMLYVIVNILLIWVIFNLLTK